MKNSLAEISLLVEDFGSAPRLEEMPKRTLADKKIAGPTAAHVIEEIHTPLNLAYVTFTTGSSAFQNIVGVTHEELPSRIKASEAIFECIGLRGGESVLVTYPPLVNVFSGQAFEKYNIQCHFLIRSGRDAFLAALYEYKPKVIIGESSFIRASLEDAKHLGVVGELPKIKTILTAGTPFDLDLLPIAKDLLGAEVHDLYGCQEFGWLCMDGVPLREDIELVKVKPKVNQDYYEVIVGGLPTGDSFPLLQSGHICNKEGKIITYRRERTYPECEVWVTGTTLNSSVTVDRVARSILRLKSRIVKVAPELQTNVAHTSLCLVYSESGEIYQKILLDTPRQTGYFDTMVSAQLNYQQNSKVDPTWIKKR